MAAPVVISAVLAAAALQGVAPANAERPVKERIKEIEKRLASREEAERLDAVRELGTIMGPESRSLLARRMARDTEAVRLEAGRAIVNHRHPYCIQALGNAIQACGNNILLATRFIKLLGDLDLCAAIPVLARIVHRSPEAREEALGAILRIGCPEAVPTLLPFLREAEHEERKPETLLERDPRTGRLRQFRNDAKDRALASWAPRIRQALTRLTGRKLPSQEEWAKAGASGALARGLVSVYLCEETGKEFELPAGSRKKCPNSKERHEDRFLKHVRKDD